jgi:hypothetical protein
MTQTLKQLRPLFLSLLIMALVAGGLPITESFAKWGRLPTITRRKKLKRYRRHSRAWWRRYRARQRARRERAERRRQERLDALRASTSTSTGTASTARLPENNATSPATSATAVSAPPLPFGLQLPNSWSGARKGANGDVTFVVHSPDGRTTGTAVLSHVTVSEADVTAAAQVSRVKLVGGAPVSALRRTVIDKMIAEGGWVVNDSVRVINGRRVFVVQAQTGAPGAPTKSRTFYFTEVEGRVYSLATTAPIEFAAPVAAGSEQVMASLRRAANSNLASQ